MKPEISAVTESLAQQVAALTARNAELEKAMRELLDYGDSRHNDLRVGAKIKARELLAKKGRVMETKPVAYARLWNIGGAGEFVGVEWTDGNRPTSNEPMALYACNAHADLVAALTEAVELIHSWHGNVAWDIYNEHSPEMKRIHAALKKAGAV